MSAQGLPALPPKLKAVQHYIKTALEHDKRDPVVAYYCRLYAMQKAMDIDRKSPDCKEFLVALMGHLEQVKKESTEEAVHSEVVGQAHVENYALKVFLFADNEDRAARFSKNVVKSFYTAGMLFDTLTVFGEISEDIEKNRKYAKWKAAYIHKCLKNGETPIPGPMAEEGEEAEGGAPIGFEQPGAGPSSTSSYQPAPSSYQPAGPSSYQPSEPSNQASGFNLPTPNQFPSVPQAGAHAPPTTPQDLPQATKPSPTAVVTDWTPPKNTGGVQLTPQQYQKAMKYCKYASSALQYEDSKTAIENLSKAMTLLTTGKDS